MAQTYGRSNIWLLNFLPYSLASPVWCLSTITHWPKHPNNIHAPCLTRHCTPATQVHPTFTSPCDLVLPQWLHSDPHVHTHAHRVPQPGKQVEMEFNEKPGPNTDTRCRAWPHRLILFRSAESTRGNGYKLEKNEYSICTQENMSLPWGWANTGTGCRERWWSLSPHVSGKHF